MKYLYSALIVSAGLMSAVALEAGTLAPVCVQGTLASYELLNSNNQCSVGILNFQDFTSSPGTPTDIVLTPTLATNGGAGFGLSGLSVGSGQTANYEIGWHFDIDPGPVSSGADLGMDPPMGNVTITQEYCFDSEFSIGTVGPDACSGLNRPVIRSLSVTVPNPTAHIDFVPPGENFANVRTFIDLDGMGQPNGSGFDSVTGTATATAGSTTLTPEPLSAALALGGLLAIAVRRKTKPLG
jgi:hypothetical protein